MKIDKIITPKVSIVCITYNHARYIKQALDSFLEQKTNFPVEIIVHDDKSTDGTSEILMEYAERHPQIIAIIEQENQYQKGNDRFINDIYKSAQGKYIALCEGDDYWTDPNKLQRQVDFLDQSPEYSICFHRVLITYENSETPDVIYPDKKDQRKFNTKSLLEGNFIQSNSVMYRKCKKYEDLPTGVLPLDWYTHLYYAQFGKIGFIDQVMSVYRRHPGGIWWQTSVGGDIDEAWKKYGANHLVLYSELLKMYGATKRYRDIIDRHIDGTIRILSRLDSANNTNLIESYAQKFGGSCGNVITSLCRTNMDSAQTQERRIAELQLHNKEIQSKNSKLQLQNSELLNSLSWKITQPLRYYK